MSYYQIAYMPYLSTPSTVDFGGFTLTPFEQAKQQLSQDVFEYLEWYFAKHVNLMQQPLKITLVSPSGQLIGPWSQEQTKNMYDAIACLCFLSIRDNCSLSPIASDNFALFIKNFVPSDRTFSTTNGSFVQTTTGYSDGAAAKVLFVRPETTPSWGIVKEPWLVDEELFTGLSSALVKARNEYWVQRLIRSIRVLNTSYINSEGVTYFDRLLLLVTSMEALIKKDTSGKKKFAQELVKLIGLKVEGEYCSGINEKLHELAFEIYRIRSKYSHGENISLDSIIHSKFGDLFKIGLFMYGMVLKTLLEKHGFINRDGNEWARGLIEFECGLFARGNVNLDEPDASGQNNA